MKKVAAHDYLFVCLLALKSFFTALFSDTNRYSYRLGMQYRIAGNFRGTKYSWFSNICGSRLHCRKVDKVASFVGKIFVVRPPTTNILPHENYPLYGSAWASKPFLIF